MWPRMIHSCCAFLGVLLLSLPALGNNASDSQMQTGSPYYMVICGKSATFDLEAKWRTGSMIEVFGGIKRRAWPTERKGFDFREEGNKVYFAPGKNTPPGTETSLRIWLRSGEEATIHVTAVESMAGVKDNVLLYSQSAHEKLDIANERNPCAPRDDSLLMLETRARARHSDERTVRSIPVVGQVARSGDGLDVSLPLSEWSDNHLVVDFEARNPASSPSELTDIRVLDGRNQPMDAELMYESGKPGDESEPDRNRVSIEARETIKGSILLPNAGKRDIEPMWLEFHSTVGESKYVTSIKVIRMRPVTEEDTERERQAKQVAISVRVLGGGFWTDDGANLGRIDGTTMTGLGVRFTKGFHHYFALEAEVVGGSSGQARFPDAAWQTMQGEIAREASFGRLQAAGVWRMGDQYVVSIRAGLGVQGTSYDSAFMDGAGTIKGPGDGFEFDGLLLMGAGFDARLGEHWILGAGATFARTFSATRSFEGGFQFGYRWSL